jgi:hypothetical protein
MAVLTENVIWPVPFPDGVATPLGTMGFVALAAGGVMAIDLHSGDERWTIADNARPLLAVDEQLVAQDLTESRSNVIALRLFDVASGEPAAIRLEPAILPDWVSTNDPDQHFAFDVFAVNADVVIDWRAQSSYRGGAAAPAAIQAREIRRAAGRVRQSLETGTWVMEAAPAPPDQMPQSHHYLRNGTWHDAGWEVGDIRVALAVSDAGGAKDIGLRRWSRATGEALAPVTLASVREPVVEVTPDGATLFVRDDAIGAEGVSSVFWSTTGQLRGQVPYADGARTPCSIGRHVFYLVDATLKAFDLKNGNLLWERALPEAPYAGPPARRM